MRVTEPMTMLTDYALAAMTSYLALLLLRVYRLNKQTSVGLWAAAFIATAAAAIIGGTSHGFALVVSDATKTALWKATVYSAGLVDLFMLSGVIVASVPGHLRSSLLFATGLKFLVYAVWMATHNDFRFVIFDYATTMFSVIILQTFSVYTWGKESTKWIIGGVLVSVGGAGIQQSGFALDENFNHNDLYHIIQMGAAYLFYKGARIFKDRSLHRDDRRETHKISSDPRQHAEFGDA